MSDITKKKVLIEVLFDDKEASQGFKNVDSNSQSLTGSVLKANLAFEAIKMTAGLVMKAFQGVVNIGKELGETFIELSKRGGVVQDVTSGFTKNFEDAEGALKDLRKASNNTISDYDLMLTASKAAMLGVTGDSKELAKLLEIASGRAQALGISTTQAFQDIVTGIGRNSPLILDNLGITTQAYNEQVSALEATGVVLDDTQKKQILLATVMQDTVEPVITATDSFEQLRVVKENLRDEIAMGLAPLFQSLAEKALPLLTGAVDTARNALTGWWEENEGFVMEQVERLKSEFGLLGESIQSLLNPTEEEKEMMKQLMNDGVRLVVDSLAGKDGEPGLIDNIRSLVEILDDKDSLTGFKDVLNDIATAIQAVNTAMKWIIDNRSGIEDAWRITSAIATTGGSEVMRAKSDGWEWQWGHMLPNKKAIGGPASGKTIVGEHGPEILDLPAGSNVTNADRTREMMGGPINVNITVGSVSDRSMVNEIARVVKDAITRENRLNQLNVGF